jgi:biopolymer transport protein ExbB/TolQ
VTAIPAAIAYNVIINRIRAVTSEMECFASEFTSVVRKELRKTL